jgi:hypothetical protein
LRGEQPIAKVHWRYQWLWLYGFVHPESGETYFWILPRVNITLFNQVLADFAQEFGLGKDKQVVLVLDQAGWHTSQQVQLQLLSWSTSGIYTFPFPRTATSRASLASDQ